MTASRKKKYPIYGLLFVFCLLLPEVQALALILHPSGEPDLETWTDKPPQEVVGRWGSNGSCVAISPNCIITTRHQGGNFTTPVHIAGHTYAIVQIWNHSTADLRIARLAGANLIHFASLYESTNEPGKSTVITGYGRGRGDPLVKNGITYGYKWAISGNSTLRFGTNRIEGTEDDSMIDPLTSDIIIADFDAIRTGWSTIYETIPAQFDSGGGWFIKQDSSWKLAGLTRAIQNHYDANDPNVALYESWFRDRENPVLPMPDYLDAVRISSYVSWINSSLPDYFAGDFDDDGHVNFADFTLFAYFWLNTECEDLFWCLGADFEPDGDLDWADLAVFAQNWLRPQPD